MIHAPTHRHTVERRTVNRLAARRRPPGRGLFLTCAAVFCAAASLPAPAAAQGCFRGRQLPDCRFFWITEVGFSLGSRNDSSSAGGATTGHLMTWELGYMRNVGERSAVGGTAFIEGDGLRMAGWRAGVKARYRLWLEEGRSVDFAPGVVLFGEEEPTSNTPQGVFAAGSDLGAVLTAGYNIGDLVSLSAQVEVIQYPTKTVQTMGYVGVRFGSYPGALAALAALVAAAFSLPAHSTAF